MLLCHRDAFFQISFETALLSELLKHSVSKAAI